MYFVIFIFIFCWFEIENKMYCNHNWNFSGAHSLHIRTITEFNFLSFVSLNHLHMLFSSFVCEKISIRMHEAKTKMRRLQRRNQHLELESTYRFNLFFFFFIAVVDIAIRISIRIMIVQWKKNIPYLYHNTINIQ